MKLHELLAAEPTAKGQATACVTDLTATFNGKKHHFMRKVSTFYPKAEEGGKEKVEEASDIQTTVAKELKWVGEIWTKAIDLSYKIDESNLSAKSDIKLDDGTVIAKDVPTTALLRLEHTAQSIHNFVSSIPTLDPAKGFNPDANENGIYKAREIEKTRTKKAQKALVLYPATPEHPAQTQLITEDVEIGVLKEQEWSSMLTPASKADMLTRCEELLRAVKTARSRSNDTEASGKKIGSTLFAFVFNGERPKV